MSENEILARGIVAGMAIVLPFLEIAIARWHSCGIVAGLKANKREAPITNNEDEQHD